MRSVVVVLPASMCAMIPMLRVFSSGKLRDMVFKVVGLKRGRAKREPAGGGGRRRGMKKALAGPAKRTANTAKKKPERRAMIAATRRRFGAVRARAARRAGVALRRRRLIARVRLEALTRRVDREVDRQLVRAWPRLARGARRLRAQALGLERWTGRRLRPAGRVLFRG